MCATSSVSHSDPPPFDRSARTRTPRRAREERARRQAREPPAARNTTRDDARDERARDKRPPRADSAPPRATAVTGAFFGTDLVEEVLHRAQPAQVVARVVEVARLARLVAQPAVRELLRAEQDVYGLVPFLH